MYTVLYTVLYTVHVFSVCVYIHTAYCWFKPHISSYSICVSAYITAIITTAKCVTISQLIVNGKKTFTLTERERKEKRKSNSITQ